MNQFLELIEHYENGQCIRRTLNGIEVPEDTFASAVQFARFVVRKTIMTREEAQRLYPDLSL